MSRTYCPPFAVVVAYMFIILISIGMIADILRNLSQHSHSAISPMTYFFILGFVAIIVICILIITHMLFPKRALLPPPCL